MLKCFLNRLLTNVFASAILAPSKPMSKRSKLLGSSQRAAGAGNAAAERWPNGLTRANRKISSRGDGGLTVKRVGVCKYALSGRKRVKPGGTAGDR